MRLIDADKLGEVKFHSLPYTHITPSDVEAESYKRGWNDAIDSIIENAPTIEPERKKGKWIRTDMTDIVYGERISWAKWNCSECGIEKKICWAKGVNFCPNCGVDMR